MKRYNVIIFDTNIYKRLAKNKEDAVNRFEYNLDRADIISSQNGRVLTFGMTTFGFCEYISLSNINITPPNSIWVGLPRPTKFEERTQSLVNEYVGKLKEYVFGEYSKQITPSIIQSKIDAEMTYHSSKYKTSNLYGSFKVAKSDFDKDNQRFSDYLIDILTIDYVHGYSHYPNIIDEIALLNFRIACISDHRENYNRCLLRSLKATWQHHERIKTTEEKSLPKEELQKINSAINRIKQGQDKFDLDLIYLFLFGYFINNQRHPVKIYTHDSPDEWFYRAFVVFQFFKAANDEYNRIFHSNDTLKFKLDSTVFFINNQGNDIDSFLTIEDFIKKENEYISNM